jgi:hypothetical protein
VFTGTGDTITADFALNAEFVIVEYTGSGEGYYGIWLKDAATAENVDLIANEIDPVGGTTLADVGPGVYFYEIEAEGNWSITTRLPSQWSRQPGSAPYNFSGSGNSVTPFFGLVAGRADFIITHDGENYFGVILRDASSGEWVDLLANEIGPVNKPASINVDNDDYIITVEADGNWTIGISQ